MFHPPSFSLPLLLLLPTLALSATLQIASLPSCLSPTPITISWTPAASGLTFKIVDAASPELISHQGSGQPDSSKEVDSFVWTPWTPTAEEEQDRKEYALTLLLADADGSQESFASNDFIVLKDCGSAGGSSTSAAVTNAARTADNSVQTSLNGGGAATTTSRTTASATGNYTMTKSTDGRNDFEKGWDDFTGLFTGGSRAVSAEVPWLGIWVGVLVGLGSGMGVLWGR